MKKFFSILTIIACAFAMISCSQSKDQTIANLKSAINGEATASAKYAAFAERASQDSLPAIASLFQATAEAESIHVKNHQAVLAELGIHDYSPVVDEFIVDSTSANLTAALNAIATPDSLATIYYVCPTCGNVYANEAPANCEFCQAPASSFIVKGEAKPVTQVVEPVEGNNAKPEATAKEDKNANPAKKAEVKR